MQKKQYIAGLYPEELKKILISLKQPAYRTKQILNWMFQKAVLTLSEMHNLPAGLRSDLDRKVQPISLKQDIKLISSMDKTAKYLFKTQDGQSVETVFIPTSKRATVCVSTQVGCAFGCSFCASGMDGLIRNLRPDEIVSQVLLVKKDNFEKPITNIVFMGMGEPLANYENTLKAIRILNNPDCLGLAARKMTISTCGLPDEIMRFAKEKLQVELSISLHAADDELRSRIMPVNRKYPLSILLKTAKEYTRITNRVITFEYVIVGGLNDSKDDAEKLVKLLYPMKAKLNLILFNPVADLKNEYQRVSPRQLERFENILKKGNIKFTVRRSRGKDIKGACGQLRAHLNIEQKEKSF